MITTTTHKTLRGPRGAMIMSNAEHATDVDKAVFPGLQGGPHNHTTAAIAVALHEAAQPEFRDYAHQVVTNAKALAGALLARGYDLVSGGTDNHLILIDLTSKGIGGKPAAKALDRAGIETNYNTVPFDQRKPFDPSGLRIGTPAITTRGLSEEHMAPLAGLDGRGDHRRHQGRRGHPRPHRRRGPRPAGRLPDPRLGSPRFSRPLTPAPPAQPAAAQPTRLRRWAGSRWPSTGCPPRTPWYASSQGQRPRLSACTSCRPRIRWP